MVKRGKGEDNGVVRGCAGGVGDIRGGVGDSSAARCYAGDVGAALYGVVGLGATRGGI